jgi:ring-1,2-phenylacetyl-CoA epoxidase subunit PaaD
MTSATDRREEAWRAVASVMDPEVPVLSVTELGIVRDVAMDDAGHVTVTVTPTYSGCPAMRVIEEEILAALAAAGFADAAVRTVYQPAWTTDWIPAEAREKLRAYGIAPPGPRDADEGVGGLVPLLRRSERVPCPYCGSRNTELKSEFGSTACKSTLVCNDCRQPFEQFKAI